MSRMTGPIRYNIKHCIMASFLFRSSNIANISGEITKPKPHIPQRVFRALRSPFNNTMRYDNSIFGICILFILDVRLLTISQFQIGRQSFVFSTVRIIKS